MDALAGFREIWFCDFEFHAPEGERPNPLCLVASEFKSGRLVRFWADEMTDWLCPPFPVGPDSLFVAYYASAELGCFLSLGWPMPARILDLYAEFRCHTAGLTVPCGNSLLGALCFHGLPGIPVAEKATMRELALRGGPYTAQEERALLDYCQSDVDALARLLPAMLPKIDLPRALLRGRYMAAAARMEWNGVPIDTEALNLLRTNWGKIKSQLVAAVNADYGVFVPTGVGEAVLREAEEWQVDPHRLVAAVDMVWSEECEADAEPVAARRAARKVTGLTARRITQLEEAGRDSSTMSGLDATARELASMYPALGIGSGYTSDGGYEGTDHAAALWETLRNRSEKPKAKSHPDILRRAAELVSASPADGADYFGPMSFSARRWADYLARNEIPWPRLATGALDLSDDSFREMARAYPEKVGPIRELRHALSQLRLLDLAVGADSRNRCLLSAFGAKTGRNQPSNARFIFGPSVWLRGLIRPPKGMALAYCDWEQQEFGIAAALSSDRAMMEAYQTGDPYLAFAKQARAVPTTGTKQTHKAERERFKVLALAVQYGMGADSLARRLDESPARGRELIRLHRETYPRYWRWSDAVETMAMLSNKLQAAFGWTVHVGPDANPRSLRNFPLQANGAEMLRIACCLTTERGIRVCAPVHDALLIEAPIGEIESTVTDCQAAMQEASEIVLAGFPLRTDAEIIRYPDRYSDPRGERFWRKVWDVIGEQTPSTGATPTPSTGAAKPLAPVLPPSSLLFPPLVYLEKR